MAMAMVVMVMVMVMVMVEESIAATPPTSIFALLSAAHGVTSVIANFVVIRNLINQDS